VPVKDADLYPPISSELINLHRVLSESDVRLAMARAYLNKPATAAIDRNVIQERDDAVREKDRLHKELRQLRGGKTGSCRIFHEGDSLSKIAIRRAPIHNRMMETFGEFEYLQQHHYPNHPFPEPQPPGSAICTPGMYAQAMRDVYFLYCLNYKRDLMDFIEERNWKGCTMTGRGRRILVDNGVFEGETLWDYTFSMHGMHDALTRADDILADARAELEYVQDEELLPPEGRPETNRTPTPPGSDTNSKSCGESSPTGNAKEAKPTDQWGEKPTKSKVIIINPSEERTSEETPAKTISKFMEHHNLKQRIQQLELQLKRGKIGGWTRTDIDGGLSWSLYTRGDILGTQIAYMKGVVQNLEKIVKANGNLPPWPHMIPPAGTSKDSPKPGEKPAMPKFKPPKTSVFDPSAIGSSANTAPENGAT